MSAIAKIWDIPGGIHPPERKELSNRTPLQQPPLPDRLILPLGQHIGAAAEPCVAVGERVLKGQKIAEASGFVSVPLHAPTSGTVSFIGPQPYPHASGIPAPAIVIDADGRDEELLIAGRAALQVAGRVVAGAAPDPVPTPCGAAFVDGFDVAYAVGWWSCVPGSHAVAQPGRPGADVEAVGGASRESRGCGGGPEGWVP